MGPASSVVDRDPAGSLVVSLDQPIAACATVTGSKAAALAVARRAGLPVLAGIVLSTRGVARWREDPLVLAELDDAWDRLTGSTARTVIVRSSSTVEDTERSSMAGRFLSVLDVRGREALHRAVDEVVRQGQQHSDAPMAVLVQPLLTASLGGVLFGADPVTGRADRIVVAAVPHGPDALVSGAEHGAHYVLGRRGRLVHADGALSEMGSAQRRALASLARRTHRLFGGPQDVEWAFDEQGRLWLLQSRPISTLAPRAQGRQYGPGPIAETFPDRLATLESDLWVGPLDEGVRLALGASGVRRPVEPTVFALDGWVVGDLDVLAPPPAGLRRIIDPRLSVRRLRHASRIGRLRAVLPLRNEQLIRMVDAQLAAVPRLDALADDDLVRVLARGQWWLRSLHGHEVLCGIVAHHHVTGIETGAEQALGAVARGRADGLDDATIVARDPVVLGLSAPRIGATARLPLEVVPPPPRPGLRDVAPRDATSRNAPPSDTIDRRLAAQREQLRTRVRVVHELTARAADELGHRWTATGALAEPAAVRDLTLDELRDAVARRRAPVAPAPARSSVASVPERFVLDERGRPFPVAPRRRRQGVGDGQGAGGGRATGVVVDRDHAVPGAVLVVRRLEPDLAPLLPGLAGLVAESGSVLSHLAILAREHGVATVVGVRDACSRWPLGTVLTVDGIAGTTEVDGASATTTVGGAEVPS